MPDETLPFIMAAILIGMLFIMLASGTPRQQINLHMKCPEGQVQRRVELKDGYRLECHQSKPQPNGTLPQTYK